MAAPPPVSSTFMSMEEFLGEPDPALNFKPTTSTDAGSLPSPAPSMGADGASTPSSSLYIAPAEKTEAINWVGLLMEYAAQKGSTSPAFADIPQIGPLEPRFMCTVKLDEREEPFGDPYQSFSRKKLAKQFACQVAMNWLAENGHISASRVPSVVPHSSTGDAAAGILEPEQSATSRVPEVCKELGLTPPTYRIKNTPERPMIWSGYAVFPLSEEISPETGGRIGQFENAMGKKNSKEECAKRVIAFLEEYKRKKKVTVSFRFKQTVPLPKVVLSKAEAPSKSQLQSQSRDSENEKKGGRRTKDGGPKKKRKKQKQCDAEQGFGGGALVMEVPNEVASAFDICFPPLSPAGRWYRREAK